MQFMVTITETKVSQRRVPLSTLEAETRVKLRDVQEQVERETSLTAELAHLEARSRFTKLLMQNASAIFVESVERIGKITRSEWTLEEEEEEESNG